MPAARSLIRASRALAALIGGATLLAVSLAPASGAEAARRCVSFESQAEAQEFFLAAGGSPSHRVGGLDPDRDGVACEALDAPFQGYATIGYNRARGFLYGTATMPSSREGAEPPCLYGNLHFSDAPRKVIVLRQQPGADRPLVGQYSGAAEAKPASGRLLWKVERPELPRGVYYATFEERVRTDAYGANECPSFSSRPAELPRPRRERSDS